MGVPVGGREFFGKQWVNGVAHVPVFDACRHGEAVDQADDFRRVLDRRSSRVGPPTAEVGHETSVFGTTSLPRWGGHFVGRAATLARGLRINSS